nr:transposase [Limosilactobacillus sp.]
MKRIGQHIYSREARLKPAELYCVNLIQETYKCDECINSNGSEMPQSLLSHSYFSSTILAKVAELKFNLALPFHRQIKLWQAIGLQVDARLLAANIIKVSQTYLEPLYDYLQGLVKKEPVIHIWMKHHLK